VKPRGTLSARELSESPALTTEELPASAGAHTMLGRGADMHNASGACTCDAPMLRQALAAPLSS